MTQFTVMPKTGNQYKHPNAMHVILSSPNLPTRYIVFDGEKYWMTRLQDWDARVEYKGATDYLFIQPSYMGFMYDLPFVVRDIPIEVTSMYWYQYQNTLK